MPTVGANLVFALLPAVFLPGAHKDRPCRGLIQLKIALNRTTQHWNRATLSEINQPSPGDFIAG